MKQFYSKSKARPSILCLLLFSFAFPALIHSQIIPIAEVHGQVATSPLIGEEVTINAKVADAFGDFWYMQDDFGAWNGILVIDSNLLVPPNPPWWNDERQPETGDELTISGTVVEDNGNTQLENVTLVEQTEFWLATFIGVTADAAGTQDESLEGTRVRLQSMLVTSEADSNDEWQISDGSGSVTCIGIDDEAIPGINDVYDIFGSLREFSGEYKIQIADIDVISLSVNELEANAFEIFPNPTDGTIFISSSYVFSGELAVNIIDLAGRSVWKANYNSFIQNESIDLTELNSGVYIIDLKTEHGSLTKRIFLK